MWTALLENPRGFMWENDHRFDAEQVTEDERIAIDRSFAVLTGKYPHSREWLASCFKHRTLYGPRYIRFIVQ